MAYRVVLNIAASQYFQAKRGNAKENQKNNVAEVLRKQGY